MAPIVETDSPVEISRSLNLRIVLRAPQMPRPIGRTGALTARSARRLGGLVDQFRDEVNRRQATRTSTTTTSTFESIGSNTDTSDDYSVLSFVRSGALTFNYLQSLVADYSWTLGTDHGGALRSSIHTTAGTVRVSTATTPTPEDPTRGASNCYRSRHGQGRAWDLRYRRRDRRSARRSRRSLLARRCRSTDWLDRIWAGRPAG